KKFGKRAARERRNSKQAACVQEHETSTSTHSVGALALGFERNLLRLLAVKLIGTLPPGQSRHVTHSVVQYGKLKRKRRICWPAGAGPPGGCRRADPADPAVRTGSADRGAGSPQRRPAALSGPGERGPIGPAQPDELFAQGQV